jgi:hypothetical protein
MQHLVSKPAQVKTPPIIAHTDVRKVINDDFSSLKETMMGEKSYLKNTPGCGKCAIKIELDLLTSRACDVNENWWEFRFDPPNVSYSVGTILIKYWYWAVFDVAGNIFVTLSNGYFSKPNVANFPVDPKSKW